MKVTSFAAVEALLIILECVSFCQDGMPLFI